MIRGSHDRYYISPKITFWLSFDACIGATSIVLVELSYPKGID